MSDRGGAPSELGGTHDICTEVYFGLATVCKADFGCFGVHWERGAPGRGVVLGCRGLCPFLVWFALAWGSFGVGGWGVVLLPVV